MSSAAQRLVLEERGQARLTGKLRDEGVGCGIEARR
jgi:hypothetical protein